MVTPVGAPAFDCAGIYGPVCSGAVGGFGNPLPEWRHLLNVSWETPWTGIELGGAWRYIGEVSLEDPEGALSDRELEATGYLDLFGSWELNENIIFRAGVNNALDEDPPLTGGDNCPTGPCSGNTWPGLYDALGRNFFIRVSARH